MSKKSVTIMLVPEKSTRVRKLHLTRQQVKTLTISGISLLVLTVSSYFLSYLYFQQRHDLSHAKDRVTFLESNLKELENRLAVADGTLSRIQNFEKRLRVITRLEDSNRNLAMGPFSPSEDPLKQDGMGSTRILEADLDVPAEYQFGIKEVNLKLSEVDMRASLQEQTMHELYELLQDQKALLTHTPSVWPVKGWLTSVFGYRASPFTGRIQMHEGIDVATRMGTPVIAPADGTIIRVHTLEGYGKTLLIDHGYGVTTRYGHNSEILAKAGDRVKRGDVIAKVGMTGITTAPHLHYEVRVNGVPVDPKKYILD